MESAGDAVDRLIDDLRRTGLTKSVTSSTVDELRSEDRSPARGKCWGVKSALASARTCVSEAPTDARLEPTS